MAYILKNKEGAIIAASPDTQVSAEWTQVESSDTEYLSFLDEELKYPASPCAGRPYQHSY
jgi:hypothetical protein